MSSLISDNQLAELTGSELSQTQTLKQIFSDIILSGYDIEGSAPKDKHLKLFVKETKNWFIVSDYFHYVILHFT